jgi:archaellum component FlaC
MNRRELKRIDTRIKAIKKAAQELKNLSGGIQAIDRNVSRILASVKMLEINVSDLLDLNILR